MYECYYINISTKPSSNKQHSTLMDGWQLLVLGSTYVPCPLAYHCFFLASVFDVNVLVHCSIIHGTKRSVSDSDEKNNVKDCLKSYNFVVKCKQESYTKYSNIEP